MTAKIIKKEQESKIPRPMNCFLAYRLEKQSEIVARCPGANHRDISKIIAKWWKEASEEEKEPYRERARLAKAEHEKLFPNYKYTPQKKPARQTRKYTRRPQNKFTSRCEENNRMMEQFFQKSAKDLNQPTALPSRDSPATVAAPVSPSKPVAPVFSEPPQRQQPLQMQPSLSHSPASPATSSPWSNVSRDAPCHRSMNVIVTVSEDQSPVPYDNSPLVSMDAIYPELSYPSSPHSVCSSYASSVDACSPECAYLAPASLSSHDVSGMASPVPTRLQYAAAPMFPCFSSSHQASVNENVSASKDSYAPLQPQFIDPRLLNVPLSMGYNHYYYDNHPMSY